MGSALFPFIGKASQGIVTSNKCGLLSRQVRNEHSEFIHLTFITRPSVGRAGSFSVEGPFFILFSITCEIVPDSVSFTFDLHP